LNFYIFEKNNLQIFDEWVLSVAKMLSCGDAKGRGGEVIVWTIWDRLACPM